MGLFSKMSGPVFLKESNNKMILDELVVLEPKLNAEGKELIKKDIQAIKYGIEGEKQLRFELQNSHLPMFVLEDLHLEFEGTTAQIDFLIITSKVLIVVECKNLYGDIIVNNKGDFIRKIKYEKKIISEGIYSPITQNQRHVDLIKARLVSNQNNIIMSKIVENNFSNWVYPLVVLANPKTILNDRYAPREIKNKIIRSDQLVAKIREIHNQNNSHKFSAKKHREWADAYLNAHTEKENTFIKKYQQYLSNSEESEVYFTDEILLEKLKIYRTQIYKKNNIKAYEVFNNKQMEEIVKIRPQTLADLQQVTRYTKSQIIEFGNDILAIINNE